MSEEIKKDNTPVIRMSVQAGIGDARAVTFETYLGADAKAELICGMLDKLNFCIDRSKAKYEIESLERQYKTEVDLLGAMEDNARIIEEQAAARIATNGKKGSNPLTQNELKAKQNVQQQIKDRNVRLANLKLEIAEKRDLIARGDISGGKSISAEHS